MRFDVPLLGFAIRHVAAKSPRDSPSTSDSVASGVGSSVRAGKVVWIDLFRAAGLRMHRDARRQRSALRGLRRELRLEVVGFGRVGLHDRTPHGERECKRCAGTSIASKGANRCGKPSLQPASIATCVATFPQLCAPKYADNQHTYAAKLRLAALEGTSSKARSICCNAIHL